MHKGVDSTPKSPIGATKEEEALAYHYTTGKAFKKIQSSGRLKSRALLISEELRSRPDWEIIKQDPKAILAALPPFATSILSELTYKPTMWFTSNAFWEPQAGHLGMGVDQVKLGLAEYQPSAQRKQPLSMEEMREKGGGLVRLGMAQNKLVHQSQLDAAIGVPLILRLIAPIGADASAKNERSSTFFGYVGESLPLSRITRIEKFIADSGWRSLDECS
jgi:hypothetical protein